MKRSLLETSLVIGGILAVACSVSLFMPHGLPNYKPDLTIRPIPRQITNPPMVGEQVINYERSGGLASITQVLEIGANGEARLSDTGGLVGVTTILPDHLASLQSDFVRMRFFELRDTYNIRGQEMSDELVKAVTYTQNGRTRRVLIGRDNEQEAAPPNLDLLLIELDQIANNIWYDHP